MINYIDDRNATLQRMAEHGGLWVTDRLAAKRSGMVHPFEVSAERGDDANKLMLRLLGLAGTNAKRRSSEWRARALHSMIKAVPHPVIVIRDAHLIRKGTLKLMRVWGKQLKTPVVLVGNVSRIAVAVEDDSSFMQRANFCVSVTRLWD